jgi:hypothetical protein
MAGLSRDACSPSISRRATAATFWDRTRKNDILKHGGIVANALRPLLGTCVFVQVVSCQVGYGRRNTFVPAFCDWLFATHGISQKPAS